VLDRYRPGAVGGRTLRETGYGSLGAFAKHMRGRTNALLDIKHDGYQPLLDLGLGRRGGEAVAPEERAARCEAADGAACRPSHAVARLAALEAARGSFEAAHAAVTRRCGPVIGKRQIVQAVVSAAGDIAAFYAARVPLPCTASTLLVISACAKGIVMRPGALSPATAKAAARQGRMRTRLTAGRNRTASGWPLWLASTTPSRPRAARTTSSPCPVGAMGTARCGPAQGDGEMAGRVSTARSGRYGCRRVRPG
jgi:hypothetical protein